MTMKFTLDGESVELTEETLRGSLRGQTPEHVRDYWVEIDGVRWPVKQVISLATGIHDRQRFQSQSARRWLGKLGFMLGRGRSEEPPPDRSADGSRATPQPLAGLPHAVEPDLVLVGCVKSKRSMGAAAKDLYTSDYFAKMRRYAEASGVPWFILSAEHGLLDPDQWLEPYERYLSATSPEYRRAWGRRVAEQLEQAIGPLDGLVIDIHAGAAYVDSVEGVLRQRGALVVDQLQGLSFGRRLSWYLQRESAAIGRRELLNRLCAESDALTLEQVIATGGAGLGLPGMYSWWVDGSGAADLSLGLGHRIDPGLIYAGLAGATRSGGSSSSNTLWGRIATMHLGRNHQFSTLRLTLGSILASAFGQSSIDEAGLTMWMYAHLRIIPIPVSDRDTLGVVETEILAELDPPLNLAKVARAPHRQRLSALRKQYGNSHRTR